MHPRLICVSHARTPLYRDLGFKFNTAQHNQHLSPHLERFRSPRSATRKDRFVSDTTTESPATAPAGRAGKGLSSMLLPELQAYAVSLGITGTARMRKGQLIEAIQEKNGGSSAKPEPAGSAQPARTTARRTRATATATATAESGTAGAGA